jgi:hypothetical protein
MFSLKIPPDGGLVLALTGGGDFSHEDGWSFAPPFSLFLPEEKEKTGRARSKREKEVGTRRTGARLNDWLKPGMTSPHAIGLSGGFVRNRTDQLLFSLALTSNRIGPATSARPILLPASDSGKRNTPSRAAPAPV